MVVITGAAGFIGSCLVKKFNQENKMNVILADDSAHILPIVSAIFYTKT